MMPLWIALYFFGACAIAAWVALPGVRAVALRKMVGLTSLARRDKGPQRVRPHRLPGWVGLVLLVTVLLCLAAPLLLVWHWGEGQAVSLPGFDSQRRDEPVVSALLQGENLVPPPPLPPELFLTPEVQQTRPELVQADRRWEQFKPEFRQRLLRVYQTMKDQHGYEMVLLEGYRSPERQTALSKLGPSVTNAGAWQSYHQYGLAADSAFMRQGKLVISERDPWARRGYELYGQLAEQAGLVWGGRWQNADLGHVELRATKQRPAQNPK